jgi:hypothetical protein
MNKLMPRVLTAPYYVTIIAITLFSYRFAFSQYRDLFDSLFNCRGDTICLTEPHSSVKVDVPFEWVSSGSGNLSMNFAVIKMVNDSIYDLRSKGEDDTTFMRLLKRPGCVPLLDAIIHFSNNTTQACLITYETGIASDGFVATKLENGSAVIKYTKFSNDSVIVLNGKPESGIWSRSIKGIKGKNVFYYPNTNKNKKASNYHK